MDVLQKEFTKLRQYLDFRLERILCQVSIPSIGSASYPVGTTTTTSTLSATEGAVAESQGRAECRQETNAWDFKPASLVPHSLDHTQDCECSFACLQWAGKTAAEITAVDVGAGNKNQHSQLAYTSPVSAAILKGSHNGMDCHCIICKQWSGSVSERKCRSASGYPCSCYDCSLAHVLGERANQEGRPSHTPRSSIHSTHSTCYEPYDPPLWQAIHSRAGSNAFKNNSPSLMLNYMLNSNAGSPPAKRAPVRSANSNSDVAGWTAPKAPSVCPPPSARWPTRLMHA